MITKPVLEEQINKLIAAMKNLKGDVEETCPISIISMNSWEWPQGVGLFAIYQYFKETGQSQLLHFLTEWFDDRIKEGLPPKNINTMCPMLTLSHMLEDVDRESYARLCFEWAEYALNEMPRTTEGGLQHVVSGEDNEGQLWDDTLYMTVLFMAKMGKVLKDDRFIQESINQFLVHLKYLTDNKTGLFYHGWTFQGNHHFAEVRWARGNSWYTAGLVDYMEIVSLPEGVRRYLLSALERQAQALSDLQRADGLWHTLLDDPDSYPETSATSAIGYGILKAVRMGYLPKSYFQVGWNALEATLSQIDKDGNVQGVSYGTGMGRTLQAYKDIPIMPMPYGQSMALLILIEGLKHL